MRACSKTRLTSGAAAPAQPPPGLAHAVGAKLRVLLAVVCVCGGTTLLTAAPARDFAGVKALFAEPPREYASAPLWVWNDLLTETQIRETLRDLAGQQVRQVFVHPRPGLMTPYLSDDWFRLWKAALDEAAKLDMNVWIYDENSYPSGFAGGWVPELMPESRGRGLHLREAVRPPASGESFLGVHRLEGDRVQNVTERVRSGAAGLAEGRYVVATVQRSGNSPWHGDRCYVDLLYPGVTEKFIEVTLEAYRRELGDQFGQRVPGVFTDEPNIRPAGGLPWTDDLPEQFRQRWGYDLLDHLPSLTREVGDWRRIRHNYYCLLSELFIERWAKPMYAWCERNGLEFTGHYWDHEWPECAGVPDNMAMAAWQQRPGVDCLMNQYAEHTHAQFGNVRYCREVSSIANQLGRARTLVELYGAGGWDLRFEDMKRIGDWLQVLGINTFDEHLSYITIRGARKRDHPQSFSYHEPWWDAYHIVARYFTRVSAAMSQGQQVNRILVLEPTTTAWMYQGHPKLRGVGDAFYHLLQALEAAQVEYDLGCEDVIARHGAVEELPAKTGESQPTKALRIGQRVYEVIVGPPMLENLNTRTRELLDTLTCRKYLPPVAFVDGRPTPSTAPAAGTDEQLKADAARRTAQLVTDLRKCAEEDGFTITRAEADRGILFHHRRQLDDGELLFLVNTSIEHASKGGVHSRLKGVQQLDPHTGQVTGYPMKPVEQGIEVGFELPPCGSLLLFLSRQAGQSMPPPAQPTPVALAARGPMEVQRVGPNVLTLDYVTITAGGETRSNVYFYPAQQFAFQKNGMDRNPWDSAVQFQDALIRRTFPADSGFTATYRFEVDGSVPGDLDIVIERPDLYTLECNGRPVRATPGKWWLDKAFGVIPLAAAARPGENFVTLQARPFTIRHELEPAYVRGSFRLKPTERGFVIVPDAPLRLAATEPRQTHGVQPDGTMWLSGGIGFTQGTDGQPVTDRTPWVAFDLGQRTALGSLRLWNYNENLARDLTARGVASMRVTASDDGVTFPVEVGTFALPRATARPLPAFDLKLPPTQARYVRFDILANHHGVKYPAAGDPPDNGFVGLAEVRFRDAQGTIVQNVRIHGRSGELASMQRQADRLIDGSGLAMTYGEGWDEQGHPFYAEGVAYRQRFDVTHPEARHVVRLPRWHGSVARVRVNGDLAGYIMAAPWELEVSSELVQGQNTVEVTVVGTLKNTLGPHHGHPGLGSAWPGMFHQGPQPGPPPGAAYHTVAYGLWEPFELQQLGK